MQGPLLAVLPQAAESEPKMEEMKENVDFEAIAAASGHHVSCFRKGDFPPPLPSLARKSYNHLPLQVPWVLLQAERGNNRVVLHEVKTAQQTTTLFQPIRKEGRLVLHMLRHDSDDEDGESHLAGSRSSSVTESSILSASSVSSTDEILLAHQEAAAIEAAAGGIVAERGGSAGIAV